MDFCDAAIGTRVRSSQVSLDGCEVANLVAVDETRRRRGFLVESFIKPPVDVIFEFPCDVDVSHVVLRPTVGSQRSTGLEVFSVVQFGARRRPDHDQGPSDDRGRASELVDPLQTDQYLLAKGVYEMEQEIVLVNEHFVLRTPFKEKLQQIPHPAAVAGHTKVQKIRMSKPFNATRRVCAVKIRIWKTANGSIPALGKVSVYGIPARGVYKSTVDRLFAHCASSIDGQRRLASDHPYNNDALRVVDKLETAVPAKFTDPLTCDVMTLPVLLPSGNTVDQVTLDRFVEAEARWGRSPSDPFTGLPFNARCKPVSNVQLKAEIDRFLIGHEHLVSGRTTGRKRDFAAMLGGTTETAEEQGPVQGHQDRKTKSTMTMSTLSRLHHHCPTSISSASQSSLYVISSSASERRAPTSLEDTLKTTLGTLPSYTSVGSTSAPSHLRLLLDQTPTDCCSCNALLSATALYRLPCSHVACRQCMTKSTGTCSGNCPKCSTSFASNQIHRIHTST